ncbi:MAG TPA: ATP-binding protein [Terriglobales bacterium]
MSEPDSQLELTPQTHRLRTEYGVAKILVEAGSAENIMARALAVMGRELNWDYCVCWRLVPEGDLDMMRVVATWLRVPSLYANLTQHAQELRVTPGVGVIGRAWSLGAPLWLEDMAREPDFLASDVARAAGLGAGVCCPIVIRGEIIGMLQFLARLDAAPDVDSLPVLTSLADQVAQFLDREAMASALAASEYRLRSLFEANIAGVHCSTLDGKAVAINPAFVKMLGFPSMAEALAVRSADLFVDASHRQALLDQLRLTGADANRQLQLRRYTGESIWVMANSVLLPGRNGAPDLNESTIIDMTESKETERRYGQISKLEGIGRLAGGIAHDFNNLLTVINGYSEMLLAKLSDNDPARPGVQRIRQAGQRAEGLTHQLMSFSRQQPVEPTVLDLAKAVQDTDEMLASAMGENIRVRHRFAPDLAHVRADNGQIGQVVMNLALNARDAMPEGGQMLIELDNVAIDAHYCRRHIQARPGRYVRLMVSDTGCGMSAETRMHAFEPFFTTKGRGQGTGLGLATVYGIVLNSGGWTEIYTELGHGTAFKLYFPQVDEPLAPVLATEVFESRGGSETILVAEDESDVREFVCTVLGEAGYRIITATDGAEALEMAPPSGERLDLLVTDVIMPRLTGPEVAEWLWEVHPRARVLFMSGYTENLVIHQGLLPERKDGMAYLQKPFAPEVLLARVRSLLDHRAAAVAPSS